MDHRKPVVPAAGWSRRAVMQGLLASTALVSHAAQASERPQGAGAFLRSRPPMPRVTSPGPLVNPPAIQPGGGGPNSYALTMSQTTFNVGSDVASLYAYTDPNNGQSNPNIVGPTITIPNNASDGFSFSIDLTNNLPLQTGAMHAGHGAGHGKGAVQGAGETPHGFNVTNIHTHGLHVAPAQDNVYVVLCPTGDPVSCSADSVEVTGNPQITPAVGSILYSYDVGPTQSAPQIPPHPAGTYWYHPHKHGSTAIQVVNASTGALIVRGDLDEIPGVAGLTEQVLVIQQIEYTLPATAQAPGVVNPNVLYGLPPDPQTPVNQQITINGQINPTVSMQAGEIQRWRVVNATYSAFISLSFGASSTAGAMAPSIYAIATDGVALTNVPGVITVPYLMAAPPLNPASVADAIMSEIAILAPGQRLDLLVQAPATSGGGTDGATFPLLVNFYESSPASSQTIATIGYSGAKPVPDPLPANSAFDDGQLIRPQFDFSGILPPPPVLGGRQSTWSINFNFQLGSAVTVQRGVGTPVTEQFDPNDAQISLELYDPARKNTTYWQVTATQALHAFHIHINSFLIAARSFVNGTDTQTFDLLPARIWRDTVRADPEGSSSSAPAGPPVHMVSQQYDYAGWYVMHCHVLDHEDFGMMVSVEIA